jgi:hypothetical protein
VTVDARWSQADVDWFALNIMDNDSKDTSNDLFAMVWDYFCIAGVCDLNPAYAGVRFSPVEQGGPYTKIKRVPTKKCVTSFRRRPSAFLS